MDETASTDPEHLVALNADDIRQLLVGHLISYAPPGTSDMGAHEEFHSDGAWRCVQYSRGPVIVSGRWHLDGDKISVEPESVDVSTWNRPGRVLWRNERTGDLLMEHVRAPLTDRLKGLLILSIRPLKVRQESELLNRLRREAEQAREEAMKRSAALSAARGIPDSK